VYRRQNQSQSLQSQQPKTFTKSVENRNPAYDQQSVCDDITDLDNETCGPYDMPADGACYDELTEGTNETYEHTNTVPGRSTPNPYEGLNAVNTTYDQPDDAPALPDRSTHSPSEDLNQETTKPNTTPVYLEPIDVDLNQETTKPNTTPDYLELIDVDLNQETTKPPTTPVYLEPIDVDLDQETTKPSTTPVYLELIDVGEEKNGTAEC